MSLPADEFVSEGHEVAAREFAGEQPSAASRQVQLPGSNAPLSQAEPASMPHLGAALGAASGPVAAFGQGWAGTGDGRWHIWLLATVCGALLGAVSYPIFWREEDTFEGGKAFGVGFAALFGFAVGLLSGAFVAFPMGSVMGAVGGALAGVVVMLLARRLHTKRFGLAFASLGGAGVALLSVWAWVS